MSVAGIRVPSWLLTFIVAVAALVGVTWQVATKVSLHVRQTEEVHEMMCHLYRAESLPAPIHCKGVRGQ